jgi:hypothetical protein
MAVLHGGPGRRCVVLMNQSSRDDTLQGVRPSPGPGRGAVSSQSSRDKQSKRSLPGTAVRREGRAISSPYETEHQALDDVRDIYEAARGSRERATMQRLSTQRLTDACAEAGVEFGAYDRSVLSWLAGFESQQAQAVTEVIRRAAKL